MFSDLSLSASFKVEAADADASIVRLRRSTTLDRIARAFAEAVSIGDYEAADGWAAVARHAEAREAQYAPRRDTRTGRVFARMYRS